MSTLGLDIGGANLKAASDGGWSRSAPFALWRDPQGLAGALVELIGRAPAFDRLAVTMTGELCDCFRTKAEGVRHILKAVGEVAGRADVLVYLTDGRFVSPLEASGLPTLAAASNWHALAQFACRYMDGGAGLLVDVGSTTTDIIPLVDGRVAARGRTDAERLLARELLYGGVGRTPVCAIVRELPWRGELCPMSAEVFATTADAHVLLGEIEEDHDANWTADGRPLTIECARQRLARQICADADDFTIADFDHAARAVRDAQHNELAKYIQIVTSRISGGVGTVFVSGSGEFLARRVVAKALLAGAVISLSERLGAEISRCGPAYAVAVLAEENVSLGHRGRTQKR